MYEQLLGNMLVPNDPRVPFLLRNVPKDSPDYDDLLEVILIKRAAWKVWVTEAQRDWQTKVSRRPERNRHSDSITIREKYVRC